MAIDTEHPMRRTLDMICKISILSTTRRPSDEKSKKRKREKYNKNKGYEKMQTE